jgi:hypothetical protein
MRKSNLEYEQRFEKLFKDFEYTLNLLVIAEPTTSECFTMTIERHKLGYFGKPKMN